MNLLLEMALKDPANVGVIYVYLAAKLVLHGKVNKADASSDQSVN